MSREVPCPHCQHVLLLADENLSLPADIAVQCPQCDYVFAVPAQQSAAVPTRATEVLTPTPLAYASVVPVPRTSAWATAALTLGICSFVIAVLSPSFSLIRFSIIDFSWLLFSSMAAFAAVTCSLLTLPPTVFRGMAGRRRAIVGLLLGGLSVFMSLMQLILYVERAGQP